MRWSRQRPKRGRRRPIPPLEFEFVEDQQRWNEIAEPLAKEPRIALDMESNGFFHYKERISLIQLGVPGYTFLLDPLAISDFSALGRVIADPKIQKILHGCDYDMRSFDREWKYHFSGLYDTAIATQLLNTELMGLGRALETYLGVKVDKQVRLQRSDWSKRPIPVDAAEYAASDAAHLLQLQDVLDAKLKELGRQSWMAEECALMEQIRYEAPPSPEQACFNAKGTFDLEPGQLAIFRELYLLRERSSAEVDRPPFKVISNDALLAIACDPMISFDKIPNANRRWLESSRRQIEEAVARGRSHGGIAHPSRQKRKPSPWTEDSRHRYQAIHEARAREALTLGIAPSTLWSTRALEFMSLNPEKFDQELEGTSECGVRQWQRQVLGPILRQAWMASGN